jgi:hypothetical protein
MDMRGLASLSPMPNRDKADCGPTSLGHKPYQNS